MRWLVLSFFLLSCLPDEQLDFINTMTSLRSGGGSPCHSYKWEQFGGNYELYDIDCVGFGQDVVSRVAEFYGKNYNVCNQMKTDIVIAEEFGRTVYDCRKEHAYGAVWAPYIYVNEEAVVPCCGVSAEKNFAVNLCLRFVELCYGGDSFVTEMNGYCQGAS